MFHALRNDERERDCGLIGSRVFRVLLLQLGRWSRLITDDWMRRCVYVCKYIVGAEVWRLMTMVVEG